MDRVVALTTTLGLRNGWLRVSSPRPTSQGDSALLPWPFLYVAIEYLVLDKSGISVVHFRLTTMKAEMFKYLFFETEDMLSQDYNHLELE